VSRSGSPAGRSPGCCLIRRWWAFSPGKSSASWPRIICRVFATIGVDKFRGVEWQVSETGSPINADTLARVDCRIAAERDAGDHLIIVGQVVARGAAHTGKPSFLPGRLRALRGLSVPKIYESETIGGLYIVEPHVHGDERGRFLETYRRPQCECLLVRV
jgi:flavin reductase like protein